jgi:hypothetical protein
LAIRLPTALAAMKLGGCSIARMIMAAPPAVGSAAISAPMNGPLRSTTIEAATTMLAVIATLSARPYQKTGLDSRMLMPRPNVGARNK